MAPPLVIIGDSLLDVDMDGSSERLCPDAPAPVVDLRAERARPGGAGLAALLAAADGRETALITPLGDDDPGRRLAGMLRRQLRVTALRLSGETPAKVRVRADGQTLVRLDTGDGHATGGPVAPAVADTLRGAGAVLVADYGRGTAGHATIRQLLGDLPGWVPVVWDPHPKGARPLPGMRLVTPNLGEATLHASRSGAGPVTGPGTGAGTAAGTSALVTAARCARHLVREWRAHAVAVTLGPRGAMLSAGEHVPLMVPAESGEEAAHGPDACGAGDRFAVTAAGVLCDGGTAADAVAEGVRSASRYVADGGAAAVAARLTEPGRAAAPDSRPGRAKGAESAAAVVRRIRRRGGVVVATGGCFDLLHAGHVGMLKQARALGDCLVVCLNSDASVRRLKGAPRPVVCEQDRERVLRALADVDAVTVFDEDTPCSVISDLCPDIWVKGADYRDADLPEDATVRACGGQTMVLPYADGHSTTRLLSALHAIAVPDGPRASAVDGRS